MHSLNILIIQFLILLSQIVDDMADPGDCVPLGIYLISQLNKMSLEIVPIFQLFLFVLRWCLGRLNLIWSRTDSRSFLLIIMKACAFVWMKLLGNLWVFYFECAR